MTTKLTSLTGLSGLKGLIRFLRSLELEQETLNLANESNDEGTSALMSDLISTHEKHLWMVSATVKRNMAYSSANP